MDDVTNITDDDDRLIFLMAAEKSKSYKLRQEEAKQTAERKLRETKKDL